MQQHHPGQGKVPSNELDRAVALKFQQAEDGNSPIPQISLRSWRFLVVVGIGIALALAILIGIFIGITIDLDVKDDVGSSTHADDKVKLYQTLNGFFWGGVGLLLEEYYKIFFAVMTTYFANRRWYPADRPDEGPTKFKRSTLFWFSPLMMYFITTALTSTFIKTVDVRVHRGFKDSDLVVTTSALELATARSKDGVKSVYDTILRNAVRGYVSPFVIDPQSKCSLNISKDSDEEEDVTIDPTQTYYQSITKVKSTSVSYGFIPRDWNFDALPHAVKPIDVFEMQFGDASESDADREARYAAFLAKTKINVSTIFDMMVQGYAMVDRAFTDSNADMYYPCTLVDHKSDSSINKRRRLQSSDNEGSSDAGSDEEEADDNDGEFPYGIDKADSIYKAYAGTPRCEGSGSTVSMFRSLASSGDQTLPRIWKALVDVVNVKMSAASNQFVDYSKAKLRVEVMHISPTVQVTAISIDMPGNHRVTHQNVNATLCSDGKFINQRLARAQAGDMSFEDYEENWCDPSFRAFDPKLECGSKSCVFRDDNEARKFRQQVTMAPTYVNCDVSNVKYDHDLESWYPQCNKSSDSVFVMGLGAYVTGTFDATAFEVPVIRKTNVHSTISFAKLDWKLEDVSKRLGADRCYKEGGCDGLLFPLANIKTKPEASEGKKMARVLVADRDSLSPEKAGYTMKNPLTLVSLNAPTFHYQPNRFANTAWMPLLLEHLNSTNKSSNDLGLKNGQCSSVIDAYLNQVEDNHFYITDPLQTAYSAAIFYLFQDANVKTVELPKSNKLGVVDLTQRKIGTTRMKGDKEKKVIRFDVALTSAVSTTIGVGVLLIYLVIVLKWPRDTVKLSDETNFPTRYAEVLIDDTYPKRVHTRQLKLPTGDVVEMDDYMVDRLVFSHVEQRDRRINM